MATNSPPVPKPRKRASHQMSSASSPNPKKRSSQDSESQEARPYQLELLDAAIDENTIVNLGTGAGKTFIAVMLIKELCSTILLPFDDENAKRTVFLVTTVPLVEQQASYVETHTCFSVGKYVGEMGVDSWSLSQWRTQFENHQVLVMTMTIFKNLVTGNYLPLSKVNLLVLDECHHAVKNHDYVQIMKLFEPRLKAGEEVPRVLGLTASLIPSKCKPVDIKDKILDLEKILCCRSQTASDLMQVARFATDPKEDVIVYESSDNDPHIAELAAILDDAVDFLERFKKVRKDNLIYELVKVYLDDLLHLLVNLGVWCADCFAKEGLRAIEEELEERGDHYDSEWDRSLLYLGRTRLKVFLLESAKKLAIARQKEAYPTTNKVKRLAHYLGDSAVVSGDLDLGDSSSNAASQNDTNKLLGIVFVQRRTTAVMLTKLLKHLKERELDLSHIRCGYVVGHNDAGRKGTYLRREAKMSVKKQADVLNSFRKTKINLLISTSVVEEGVDVPRCNLVVRFDFPENLRAFIQSKGRARAKVSKYLLLIDSKERGKQLSDLRDYRSLENELKSICQDRHVPDEEAILQRMEEEVAPYMPLGREGPIGTLGSSLSLVHKYCQKLPKDRYTILTPFFKTMKIGDSAIPDDASDEVLFQSTLTLPMNCPLREPIEGQPMPTRHIAEKSAALEAVKLLHQAGELDNHLKPVTKDDDSDLEDEEKVIAKSIAHAGTEKRHDYYPNRVASSLSGCFPVAGCSNYLYIFVIRMDEYALLYQYLPPLANSFGILTRKPLPHIKVPKFSLYSGKKTLNIDVVKYHSTVGSLSQRELDLYKLCHEVLFTELLKITGSWLELNFESSDKDYLVVPLSLLPDEEPLEAFLNSEVAEAIIKLKSPSGSSFAVSDPERAWPLPLECFHNAIVTDIHMPPDQRKLCKVRSVNKMVTPLSAFPNPSVAPTYSNYFQTKYNCPITDLSQPALDCKYLGVAERQLKLLKPRKEKKEGEDLLRRKKKRDIKLFPELCSLYPVPTTVWKLARCLPSILWRIECILSVEEFRSKVTRETGIGLQGDGSEVVTQTFLHGDKDEKLLTQSFTTIGGEVQRQPISSPDIKVLTQRGPDNALLLQAFTPKGANDIVNLERLETLGDSFLKLVTSVFLFHDRQGAHEGRLSSARSRRVGNLNLFLLAKQDTKKITEHIFSTSFEPRQMWMPPCFSFNEHRPDPSQKPPQLSADEIETHSSTSERARHYLFHKVTDKGVADCVESLIGAYLVSGGIDAALKFMKWVGIKIESEAADTDTKGILDVELQSVSSRESVELTTSSSSSASSNSSSTPPLPKRLTSSSTPSAPRRPTTSSSSSSASSNSSSTPPLPKRLTSSSTPSAPRRPTTSSSSSSASSNSSLTPPLPKRRTEISQWLSLERAAPNPLERGRLRLSQCQASEPEPPLLMRSSSAVFQNHFPPPPKLNWNRHQEVEIEKLLGKCCGVSKDSKLNQIFKLIRNRSLLLQALTHASYIKNRVTDCYQQLEFLGDAVLDYLVTCHVYSTFPEYKPGDISAMRSALVNNNTFAELTVKLELHKAILHSSPTLFSQINAYVSTLSEVRAADEEVQLFVTDNQPQGVNEDAYGERDQRSTPTLYNEDSIEEDVDELDPPKVLGDVLESIAGAIFVDSGCCLESVWSVFKPLFVERIASFNGKVPILPVQELYELEPTTRAEKTRLGNRKVRCTITFIDKQGAHRQFSARSTTYKAAKSAAARAALKERDRGI